MAKITKEARIAKLTPNTMAEVISEERFFFRFSTSDFGVRKNMIKDAMNAAQEKQGKSNSANIIPIEKPPVVDETIVICHYYNTQSNKSQ